jgi:Tripartite tricarboxylate transporter family receptor
LLHGASAPLRRNSTRSLGSPGHIATIAFNKLAGLNLVIAAYRGTAPGLAAVAAGHVRLMIDPVLALLPMARGGQVKALAITTGQRSTLAPDIPTAGESGHAGSSPRRHRRLLSDDDPRPLATLAQQRVELGAAHCDGATIRQGHCSARRLHGHDQVVFRG